MMMFFTVAMALTALAGEWLAMPMPDGFVTAHKQEAQAGAIEERIATGETVQRWTRMITMIRLNQDYPAANYARAFEDSVLRDCKGATATPRIAATIGAHPAIASRIACPLNAATGLPETFLYRVATVGGRLHMVQVAFRRDASPADIAWAEARLDEALLCAPGATEALCSR